MKVVAVQPCFVGGSERIPGRPTGDTPFEYTPVKTEKNPKGLLPKYLKEYVGPEVKEPTEPAKYADKDNSELRAMLAEAGIKAAPQWRREKLLEALAELEGK